MGACVEYGLRATGQVEVTASAPTAEPLRMQEAGQAGRWCQYPPDKGCGYWNNRIFTYAVGAVTAQPCRSTTLWSDSQKGEYCLGHTASVQWT